MSASLSPKRPLLRASLNIQVILLLTGWAIMPAWGVTSTIYVGQHFEVRDHDAPTKYVFNGSTRVARVTRSLTTNFRVQRLRVWQGWNLVSLAVTGTNFLSQILNTQSEMSVYPW